MGLRDARSLYFCMEFNKKEKNIENNIQKLENSIDIIEKMLYTVTIISMEGDP